MYRYPPYACRKLTCEKRIASKGSVRRRCFSSVSCLCFLKLASQDRSNTPHSVSRQLQFVRHVCCSLIPFVLRGTRCHIESNPTVEPSSIFYERRAYPLSREYIYSPIPAFFFYFDSCSSLGFYYRVPGITGDQWHCMSRQRDFTWKQVAIELMLQYVKRTQGSFIENKVSLLRLSVHTLREFNGCLQFRSQHLYMLCHRR